MLREQSGGLQIPALFCDSLRTLHLGDRRRVESNLKPSNRELSAPSTALAGENCSNSVQAQL